MSAIQFPPEQLNGRDDIDNWLESIQEQVVQIAEIRELIRQTHWRHLVEWNKLWSTLSGLWLGAVVTLGGGDLSILLSLAVFTCSTIGVPFCLWMSRPIPPERRRIEFEAVIFIEE